MVGLIPFFYMKGGKSYSPIFHTSLLEEGASPIPKWSYVFPREDKTTWTIINAESIHVHPSFFVVLWRCWKICWLARGDWTTKHGSEATMQKGTLFYRPAQRTIFPTKYASRFLWFPLINFLNTTVSLFRSFYRSDDICFSSPQLRGYRAWDERTNDRLFRMVLRMGIPCVDCNIVKIPFVRHISNVSLFSDQKEAAAGWYQCHWVS